MANFKRLGARSARQRSGYLPMVMRRIRPLMRPSHTNVMQPDAVSRRANPRSSPSRIRTCPTFGAFAVSTRRWVSFWPMYAPCMRLGQRACLTVRAQTEMLFSPRGEVRESGLTGVTRNHVCPRGTGGSNPPLSASQSPHHRSRTPKNRRLHIEGLGGSEHLSWQPRQDSFRETLRSPACRS